MRMETREAMRRSSMCELDAGRYIVVWIVYMCVKLLLLVVSAIFEIRTFFSSTDNALDRVSTSMMVLWLESKVLRIP